MVQTPLVLEMHPEREALIDQALDVFQPMSKRTLTRDDAREAIHNLMGAYLILLEVEMPVGGAQ